MQRPRISVNFAISADGKISSEEKRASGWTSHLDHQRLLDLRKGVDALMVGKGTLLTDRMTMTVPHAEKQPLRCIISRSGELPAELPIFQKPGGAIHLCVTGGADVHYPRVTVHHQSLRDFLETLTTLGVHHLHCEGGGELVHSLAALDAVDEIHCTLAAHTLWGGKKSPTLTGLPGVFLESSLTYEIQHMEAHPELGECFMSYVRKR